MNRANTNVGADLADLGQVCTWFPSCTLRLPVWFHLWYTHIYLKDSENRCEHNKTFLKALWIEIEKEALPVTISTYFSFLAYLSRWEFEAGALQCLLLLFAEFCNVKKNFALVCSVSLHTHLWKLKIKMHSNNEILTQIAAVLSHYPIILKSTV